MIHQIVRTPEALRSHYEVLGTTYRRRETLESTTMTCSATTITKLTIVLKLLLKCQLQDSFLGKGSWQNIKNLSEM